MNDILLNPWFLGLIFLSIIIGNIAVLKYTANMKMPKKYKQKQDDKDQKDKS
jgi:hypothetical protein